ncbi:MAG: hypothetical protein Q9227_004385 [Pyrenula ochraceoflavens]
MEGAPLTLAQNHARNALLETRRANPVAASEEHDLAATEFASAAEGTQDSEAIRVLNLLEQHHKQLGQLLKLQHEHPPKISPTDEVEHVPSPSISKNKPLQAESTISTQQKPPSDSSQAPPRLHSTLRRSGKDLTTSIASNLASARGIPGPQPNRRGTTAPSTVSADQAGETLAKGSREKAAKTSRDRPEHAEKQQPPFFTSSEPPLQPPKPLANPTGRVKGSGDDQEKTDNTTTEQTFQQFYSTFENVLSKISAPLAFTGLPLTGPVKPSSPQTPKVLDTAKKSSSRISPSSSQASAASIHTTAGEDDGPDYSKFISRAALQAVRDNNPSLGGNPAESFYVVPTSGGTVSYAGILNRAERDAMQLQGGRHTRQLSNISEDTNDDFQDAREMPIPSSEASPEIGRDRRGRRSLKKEEKVVKGSVSNKTMEELEMENDALKRVTDLLSKRLHMWEVNAQSSSAALQQSLRSLHQQPQRSNSPLRSASEGIETDDDASRTISQLEGKIRKAESDRERQKRENEKLKTVVDKYRDRWEKLKEGARVRREGGVTRTKSNDAGQVKDTSIAVVDEE